LLKSLEETLLPQALGLAAAVSGSTGGIAVGDFDVISGLAGVGAYLLCRRDEPGPATALAALLRALVDLTREDAGRPRWFTPPHLIVDQTMRRQCPNGNLNCGLAHGIPGPLSLLALARIMGVRVAGMEGAIDRIAGWLAEHRLDDAWGVNWPTVVPLAATTEPSVPSRVGQAAADAFSPSRTAWCYGSPGIARALWLAGEALDDSVYRDLAVAAMEAVYRMPLAVRRIDSPTFCHGVAGLLQITLRFTNDTGLAIFIEAARTLTTQLLSLHEPETLLGYRHIEAGGRRIDQPGLLDGAPGVALVLLAAATDAVPTWDRLFLLS
jgi:hypothetical protein